MVGEPGMKDGSMSSKFRDCLRDFDKVIRDKFPNMLYYKFNGVDRDFDSFSKCKNALEVAVLRGEMLEGEECFTAAEKQMLGWMRAIYAEFCEMAKDQAIPGIGELVLHFMKSSQDYE